MMLSAGTRFSKASITSRPSWPVAPVTKRRGSGVLMMVVPLGSHTVRGT